MVPPRCPRSASILALGALLAGPAQGEVWEVGNHLLLAESWGEHVTPQANARFGSVTLAADLFGDGIADAIVSAPLFDDLVSEPQALDAGLVDVFYSDPFPSGDGVRDLGPFPDGYGARYGAAMAIGDFDADGSRDLVTAFPFADVGLGDEAGGITIAELTLDGSGEEYLGLNEATPGVPGDPESFDHFGQALAVGYFDGDAYADLAIGVPGENLESPSAVVDAGSVTVVYGGPGGLTSVGIQTFDETALGGAQAGAGFGAVLVAADFDGDGYSDLAVGVPLRDVFAGSNRQDAGQVVILFGGSGGLTTTGHQRISDDVVAANERFGAALAAADFGFSLFCIFIDCFADLAIGVPGQLDLGHPESGKVVVLDGGDDGLNTAERLHLYQDLLLDGGSQPEDFDHFGAALAAGSVGAPFSIDLIIGVPDEDLDGTPGTDQGMVHLVFGGVGGLLARPGQALYSRLGLASFGWEDFDHFGAAIAAGDFDGDAHGDLLIGIPGRNLDGALDGGAVQVMYGAIFADGFESGWFDYWD
jgi:hypothetical protein